MTINKAYPCNKSNYRVGRTSDISFIVIHYVGATGSALENCKYYGNNSGLQASAHYFIGHESENGAIYQSVSEDYTAWHCGTSSGYKHPSCRNSNSIGIEMCCHKNHDNSWYFDDITVQTTALFVRELMAKYQMPIENVLRHYDVTGKICPEPYIDESAWEEFKQKLIQEETKIMDLESAKEVLKEKTGLSDNTIQYLLFYKYGEELVIKLANAVK